MLRITVLDPDIIIEWMLAILEDERLAVQRGAAQSFGRCRFAVKRHLVYRACAGQVHSVNQLLGLPAVDLHLAAADVQAGRRGGRRPDRRAVAVGIFNDQLSGALTVIWLRLAVNGKPGAAAVDQSALDGQRNALAEGQTADLRAVYRQIPVDGHIALHDVELAAQIRIR